MGVEAVTCVDCGKAISSNRRKRCIPCETKRRRVEREQYDDDLYCRLHPPLGRPLKRGAPPKNPRCLCDTIIDMRTWKERMAAKPIVLRASCLLCGRGSPELGWCKHCGGKLFVEPATW